MFCCPHIHKEQNLERKWGGERRGSVGNVGLMRVMWEDI